MPSLNAKDRTPLCLFSYEDGRRCRTPRIASHPHFCFYHAKKESQSQAAEKLADDLAYFFSGKYLTANDLNAALARLIPATIRGEIKPRLARTVAYMLQTLMQSTRQAQHEYINAFSTDGWRQAVANSVHNNHDHLYPKPPASTESEPDTPPAQQPATPPSPSTAEAALNIARALFPERPNDVGSAFRGGPPTQPTPQPAAPIAPVSQPTPQVPAPIATASETGHAERSEAPRQNPTPPTTDETHLPTTITQPTNPPPPPRPPTRRQQPTAVIPAQFHFDHTHRLTVNGKPW
jgi:hypothetical protein